ncbi:hypothetical protein MHLP_01505 [Candidatus Mycoplasma haematolamae str. Purdue]|uniref:Uncharacterized protein n=1 Tax=Mycoplasma haematolamae (strain Purdue) TaxID=1212765 RepID=I7CF50_MYCHA|nr:hypothetical protein [Candidatus Mycoplasma haematolamae]AFO51881.1 hypothetical protein MHLP_01505 [Candidatus Mycoplasma haematolamae str. Purdue]
MIPLKAIAVGASSLVGAGVVGGVVYAASPERLQFLAPEAPKHKVKIEAGKEVSFEFTSSKTITPVILKCDSKPEHFPYLEIVNSPPGKKNATIKCNYKKEKQVLGEDGKLPFTRGDSLSQSFRCSFKDKEDENKFFCELAGEDLTIRVSEDVRKTPQLSLDWGIKSPS